MNFGQNVHIPDSTQSRDCEEDYINLPVTDVLTIDTYTTVILQIVLFQQNSFDEFNCVSTYIADIIYAAQNFHNPPVMHAPCRRWLTSLVGQLISSGYLFARVSSYFSLYFMTGQFRIFMAVLLTNPEE